MQDADGSILTSSSPGESIMMSRSFAQNLETYLTQLIHVSNCIQKLNIILVPDDEERCIEFKNRQLKHLLSGEIIDINKMSISSDEQDDDEGTERENNKIQRDFRRIIDEVLHWSDSRESHLGALHARDVGCHSPELSDDCLVSALELHGDKRWCQNCLKHNHPDFLVDKLNPFNCWRRGHQSSKMGFIQLSNMSNSGSLISLKPDRFFAAPELSALLNYERKKKFLFHTEISMDSSAMVAIFIIDNQPLAIDRMREIKRVLPAQLLVSRHIDSSKKTNKSRVKHRDDKMPEMVNDLLNKVHSTWKRRGPSKDSRGIIGVALVNNECEYISNGGLESTIDSFRERNKIWTGNYSSSDLNNGFKKLLHISDSNLPTNYAALCVILDPIIDLGGLGNE